MSFELFKKMEVGCLPFGKLLLTLQFSSLLSTLKTNKNTKKQKQNKNLIYTVK